MAVQIRSVCCCQLCLLLILELSLSIKPFTIKMVNALCASQTLIRKTVFAPTDYCLTAQWFFAEFQVSHAPVDLGYLQSPGELVRDMYSVAC